MLKPFADDGFTIMDLHQPFTAYRSLSDEFEICFVDGPLDGTRITTDTAPNSDRIIHRVRGRTYVYRYLQVSPHVFHANLDGFKIHRAKAPESR